MVTTGAMTNRIDRLEERGFVERSHSITDRRRVVVAQLTETGLDLVDTDAESHYRFEEQLLAPPTADQQANLVNYLRRLLLHLDDIPQARVKATSDPLPVELKVIFQLVDGGHSAGNQWRPGGAGCRSNGRR